MFKNCQKGTDLWVKIVVGTYQNVQKLSKRDRPLGQNKRGKFGFTFSIFLFKSLFYSCLFLAIYLFLGNLVYILLLNYRNSCYGLYILNDIAHVQL